MATHKIKQTNVRGKSVRYYSCGEGEQTILTFSGGHSGLETVYETILGFENDYRIVVVDISLFKSLSEFRLGVDMVLEREGVGRLFVIGQSLSGVYSQIYFKENYDSVDAMVLTNTFAPSRKKRKKWPLILLRFFPHFLLKAIFKQKIRKWTPKAEILVKRLPHTEQFLFPEGYRHMAPMVFRDEYQNKIKDFFRDVLIR